MFIMFMIIVRRDALAGAREGRARAAEQHGQRPPEAGGPGSDALDSLQVWLNIHYICSLGVAVKDVCL